ncbi:MAG: threonylcarbamoyl-AMP synthase [Sebaldella sp.]|nr:threonylcarbamoyl-AMP synthase [Sebaldella sp.]
MNKQKVNESSIEEAVKVLKNGGTVIFPTDTVYGLGTSFTSLDGIENIYKIKKRDISKPLIALISDVKYLEKLIDFRFRDIKEIQKIIEKYWPGELTIVFRVNENIPKNAISDGNTIGVRIPKNEISLKIIENSGGIVFTTSANISGESSPRKIEDISSEVLEHVDLVLDNGNLNNGIPSTIIKYVDGVLEVLREGNIRKEEVLNLFRRVEDR